MSAPVSPGQPPRVRPAAASASTSACKPRRRGPRPLSPGFGRSRLARPRICGVRLLPSLHLNQLGTQIMSLERYLRMPMIAAAGVFLVPGPALAQQPPQPGPPPAAPIARPATPAATPMPATADLYRMIWSTIAAVEGANAYGKYSS